jgi:hypothetical protein
VYCTGHDCSQEAKQGYWEVISPNLESTIPPGTASHASVIYNNSLWVFGGNNLTLDPRGPIPINRYEFDGIKTFFSHVQAAEILIAILSGLCQFLQAKFGKSLTPREIFIHLLFMVTLALYSRYGVM